MKKWDFERALFGSTLEPSQRLLLLCLAALANSSDCVIPAEHTPSLSRLESMSGLSRSTVAKVLNELEEAGWIGRKRPSVADSRLRKIRTQYRLKVPKGSKMVGLPSPESFDMASPTIGLAHPDSTDMASPTIGPASPTIGLGLVRPSDSGLVRPSDTYPTAPTNSPAARRGNDPATIVAEFTGATPEEAEAVANRIRNERQPKNLAAFIRRLGEDGDLVALLAEHRGSVTRANTKAALESLRKGPTCIHGDPGGASLHPVGNEPLCARCRKAHQLKNATRRSA